MPFFIGNIRMNNNVLAIALITILTPALYAKNFILISAPGSGKGTFSQYLIENYGYVQICPGDLFRNEINKQTELGKKIQPIVEAGEYVDEALVCQLIADNLLKVFKQAKPFIIDGFPRSKHSFQFLKTFFQDANLTHEVCFLQFIASDDTCINRISTRQVCTICFKVYNSVFVQPKEQNRCDQCDATLTLRTADTHTIVKKRLAYFHASIESLLQEAQNLYEVKKIETECSMQELYSNYDNLIKGTRC